MRIVQAVGWYPPDSLGGTELYVSALATHLRRHGHEVRVTAPDPGRLHAREYVHDGIPVFRYPIPDRPTRSEARGHVVVRGAEHLHRWLADWRPDVVHMHTFVTGLGLREAEAATRVGAKVVVTSHAASLGFVCERGTLLRYNRSVCDGRIDAERCSACALERRGVPLPLAALASHVPAALALRALAWPGRFGTLLGYPALIEQNRAALHRVFELISTFVVLSEYAATVLRSNGAPIDKVVVNRLGVMPRTGGWPRKAGPRERPTKGQVTVGFVGRAESIKGLEDAVRAVRSIPPDTPVRLRAIVLATHAVELDLVDRCRALAAGDSRITIEPAVPAHAVPALLSSLDVLICPSRAVEGGPTVALEAFAVGTPVIGAEVPALSEMVTPGVNGMLYPVGDWRALARVIASAVRDPAATIDRWRGGIVAPRTLDDIAREYDALYARVH